MDAPCVLASHSPGKPGRRVVTPRRALRLWAATGDAIARLDEADGGWDVSVSLEGTGAQCLAVDLSDPDTAFAGLREHGLRRTRDAGETWEDVELPEPGVFSLAVSAADGAVYAGCEPSRLFRSDDGGDSWRALDALLELPSRPNWSFPPRPWTSHVRWIAPSPHDADLLLVGIELGGLMRSTDGGESWQDHGPERSPTSTRSPGTRGSRAAYEAGGGGSAWSDDAGESWHPADEGRDRNYVVGGARPGRSRIWFLRREHGAVRRARGRDAQARIYRREGDRPWEEVADPGLAMP